MPRRLQTLPPVEVPVPADPITRIARNNAARAALIITNNQYVDVGVGLANIATDAALATVIAQGGAITFSRDEDGSIIEQDIYACAVGRAGSVVVVEVIDLDAADHRG
jgi:hypothetical protein